MGSLKSRRAVKRGQMPGTVSFYGEKKQEKVFFDRIHYNEDTFQHQEISSHKQLLETVSPSQVDWINLAGLHGIEEMEKIAEIYHLDHLTLEDILNTEQRPKFEEFEAYLFFTFKMFHHSVSNSLSTEQVSLVLTTNNTLVTFQEQSGDVFEPLRKRISQNLGKVRGKGADYLFYLILDIIVDDYFIHLERINEKILSLEDVIIKSAGNNELLEMQILKKELDVLSRSIYPLREAIGKLQKVDSQLFKKSTHNYLRDLYDHAIAVFENVESLKENLSNLRELYSTMMGNKMNEIMKILTIVSSIFIPLTFIAGIYGMNFKYLPELEWRYAYFAVWSLMLLIAAALLYVFNRKKWL